jgi:7-keto-8-aminopelargonate synthetase-like enzyme
MYDDEKIASVIDHVQKSGKTWFGPTFWKGKKGFRISISSHVTTNKDVDIALQAIKDAL